MYNNKLNRPKCGEIWMCDLPKSENNVQNGYRPVFILSNDKNNTYAPTLNVIPITTKMNKRQLPVHVELWDYEKFGLLAPSTMMVEQITTVQMSSVSKPIGRIDDIATLRQIKAAICVQFPIVDGGFAI